METTVEQRFIAANQDSFNAFVAAEENELRLQKEREAEQAREIEEQAKASRLQSLKDRLSNLRRESGIESLEQEIADIENPAQG